MADPRTTKPGEERLENLEKDIETVRENQERKQREQASDRFRFATPEAYEAERIEREALGRDEDEAPDPMEQPTPARMGNVAHAILDDEEDDKSETQKAAERATKNRA